jgi:Flp pilus assembly protein TadG
MQLRFRQRQRGVATVETAIVFPLLALLVIMAIDLTGGIYRYHQIATLSRAAARYASVHAGQFAEETRQPAATLDTIRTNVLNPLSVGMDSSKLACAITWLPFGSNYPYRIDSSSGSRKQNAVRVQVSYPWRPISLFLYPITLTSTSEMTISY